MTKKDLARMIADGIGISGVVALQAVQMTFDGITKALVEEGRIELRNFGVFEIKKRKARKARNPAPGRWSRCRRGWSSPSRRAGRWRRRSVG